MSDAPRVEPRFTPQQRHLPAVDVLLETLRSGLVDRDRRGREVAGHLRVRRDDKGQVGVGPWLEWMPALDVLQRQCHPAALVVRPQQSGYGSDRWERGENACLPAVDAWSVRIRLLADAFMNTRRPSLRRSRAARP